MQNNDKQLTWLTDESRIFLSRGYIPEGKDYYKHFKDMGDKAEKILNLPGYSDRFMECVSKGWFLIPTPSITNFNSETESAISCFASEAIDTIDSILYTQAEIGAMSKIGGGTSVYLGNLRGRGSKITGGGESGGAVHFGELFQTVTDVVSQRSRRGKVVEWLDMEHPDIMEHLAIRTEGHPLQRVSFGVIVGDDFVKSLHEGNSANRKIWARMVKARFETGYPYIMFKDNVNKVRSKMYQDKDLEVKLSNLCSEITLNTDKDTSFVCCLLGMNLMHFDAWKDTDAVEVAVYFMDAMLTDFINKSKTNRFLERAVNFAERERAIGLGFSGFHSYLQSKMIPIESLQAKSKNVEIFKLLKTQSDAASAKMAVEYGEPEFMKGYGFRHSHRIAGAPNTSSSTIFQWIELEVNEELVKGLGSQSIEPYMSNYYIKDTAKMKLTIRNPYLTKLLIEKGYNNEEVWKSILQKEGSVQHLDFLTENEKEVFKIFSEISPMELVIQQSVRQKYIDQSVSFNLSIPNGTPAKDVSDLLLKAHELGIKTLYYQLNENAAQKLSRSILECSACSA